MDGRASSSWVVEGKHFIFDAFLDLNYTAKNSPTLYNGYISGTLSSKASAIDPGYFDPFSIFSFPTLPNYNYSLLDQVQGKSSTDSDVAGKQWPSYEENKYCWVIMEESIVLELEYAEECSENHHHCSPVGTGDGIIGSLPRFLLFTPIQCSAVDRKMRYLATFQNTRDEDQGFGLNSTVIGEASWDDKKNELFGFACRLLGPLNRSANEVGDCTMRLSLRYTSIITVRNDPKLAGRFRSTKHADKSGYFRKINITKSDGYGLIALPYVRYEYTKLDEARRVCAVKKAMKRGEMNTYPDVSSDNMRFGLSVQNSSGQNCGWISASPLWVGNNLYRKKYGKSIVQKSGDEAAEISESYTSHSNIAYMIRLNSHSELEFGSPFESLYLLTNGYYVVEITAEGVYNSETGFLCMVGCRKIKANGGSSTYVSRDCEIIVTLQFAPLTGEGDVPTKGAITSTRTKTDLLHFEEIIIYSNAYDVDEATRAIWRMDMEIAMVLISDTFVCIFVALQIFHVRRNYSKVPFFISLIMLLILSVGHMIPLILNFEDAHLRRYPVKQVKAINHGGRLESNEVAVRLSSLVAFLLQLRLLQLVWTAKQRDVNGSSSWSGERKAGFVVLALYVVAGLLALLLNCTRKRAPTHRVNSEFAAQQKYIGWGSLRSYGGLIMDGFLLPQVLLNVFTGTTEKALSHSFYGGISAVRVAPHAYNLYRLHNYPARHLKRTYYYANPGMGFYSRAWDIIVPLAIITLAVIISLQQRRRGHRL